MSQIPTTTPKIRSKTLARSLTKFFTGLLDDACCTHGGLRVVVQPAASGPGLEYLVRIVDLAGPPAGLARVARRAADRHLQIVPCETTVELLPAPRPVRRRRTRTPVAVSGTATPYVPAGARWRSRTPSAPPTLAAHARLD